MKKTTFYGSLAALLLILNMNFGGFYISPILENISSPLVSSLVSDILFFIPPALLYFAVSRTAASDIPKTLGFKDPGSKNIILILGMSIFIQPFLMFLSGISSLFYTNAASEYLETMFDMPALSMLTITSVAPAVFEELYFRGIVFSGFRRLNIVLACVLCGLLFGMAHLHPQSCRLLTCGYHLK